MPTHDPKREMYDRLISEQSPKPQRVLTPDQKFIINELAMELELAMKETKPGFEYSGKDGALVMTESQRHDYVRRCFRVALDRMP